MEFNPQDYPIFEIFATIFGKVWEFFELQFPGAPFTFAQMITGTMIILVSLNLLGLSFGVGDGNESEGLNLFSFFSSGRGESGREKPHFKSKK